MEQNEDKTDNNSEKSIIKNILPLLFACILLIAAIVIANVFFSLLNSRKTINTTNSSKNTSSTTHALLNSRKTVNTTNSSINTSSTTHTFSSTIESSIPTSESMTSENTFIKTSEHTIIFDENDEASLAIGIEDGKLMAYALYISSCNDIKREEARLFALIFTMEEIGIENYTIACCPKNTEEADPIDDCTLLCIKDGEKKSGFLAPKYENIDLDDEYYAMLIDEILIIFNQINVDLTGNTTTDNTETEKEEVLIDNKDIKITFIGCKENTSTYYTSYTGGKGFAILLIIENKTNKNIIVQERNCSVNNIMCEPIFSEHIAAGKIAFTEMEFAYNENIGTTFDDIKFIELCFYVINQDDWSDTFKTEVVHIDLQ